MIRYRLSLLLAATTAIVALSGTIATADGQAAYSGSSAPATDAVVARGKYLVSTMGCNDCHTPWKMGPRGPEPDMTRELSGHPSDLVMPPAPKLEGPWGWVAAATNTAFAGPWGVSFTANLTPDKETGLGTWTYDMFIQTMKTGRHQGKGRPVKPPMPVQIIAAADEESTRAIWAYLQSLKPIHNRVPDVIDPPEPGER
jgi:hypothetical protein